MGGSQSYPGLTEDLLDEYVAVTFLTKGEILYLMKKFHGIDPEKLRQNSNHRFSKQEILQEFEVLQNNPFQDRLFRVFSSEMDDRFSFEDLLDLYSAMSADCPADTKAAWAFRIYDIDEDNQISKRDICEIIDRLTGNTKNSKLHIDKDSKEKIAQVLLNELRLDSTGSIGLTEFKVMMSRTPEFPSSFYFRL
ncbi:hypothetical protein O0L34_g7892 [Tuta absoluta]|nr:hypothetical protein O0L34_g7892 [Tuta absoluta]